MPRVAVLGTSSSPVVGIEYERHPEWSALAALPAYDIVLLDLPAVRAGEALRSLRMDKRYRFSLIYCCQEQHQHRLVTGIYQVHVNKFYQISVQHPFNSPPVLIIPELYEVIYLI